MPFEFDPNLLEGTATADRCIEDRRDNPVRNRTTRFRILQANALAYTFGSIIPGFAAPGINRLPFSELAERPTVNAVREGEHLFGDQFALATAAIAKVNGDIFQTLDAAILWNAAARWNRWITSGEWEATPRYPRPTISRDQGRRIAVLTLPRRYDWVKLLGAADAGEIDKLRDGLRTHGDLLLPTSTPDIMVVALPETLAVDEVFETDLPGLDREHQVLLERAYQRIEGTLDAGHILLAIACKKSLRSDRLYQPLYEANIMQLLLEGRLGAPRVEFEVHTLESEGTGAAITYRAASLAGVATNHAEPHRAIRDLYEPENADALVRRFYEFLNQRLELIQ